jgi:selenium metabolism protein YedF
MNKELDCRGLACPAPVLQIKELLDKDALSAVTILVDNEAAWENVRRFLEYQHFQVETERLGPEFRIVGRRGDGESSTTPEATAKGTEQGEKKILVLVATERMGHGDDGLGAKLLISFLKTLKEMGPDLWRLVFINGGVTLTAAGAEALPILQGLEADGVRILVCGTCLTHFHLLDQKQVGETTNMLDIVTGMQLADSVITI